MLSRCRVLFAVVTVIGLAQPLCGLDNGLSIRPHMGYNTWNCFYGSSTYGITESPDQRADRSADFR